MEARIRPSKLRALVIAYGNPLRGDDALGWRAAEFLDAVPEIADDPSIRIETVHQLTPELADSIAGTEMVIFLDATVPTSGLPPGSLRCEEIDLALQSPEALGHHLTPAQALAYAMGLFGAKPAAYVASVAAASFAYGAPLTPAVEAAIPSLARWVRRQIETGCAVAS
jgi:hydrogenase maturation protease